MKFLIKPNNDQVRELYTNHGVYNKMDSGLDLFIPQDLVIPAGETVLVNLEIKAQLIDGDIYRSFMLFPRSSISKTPLRVANSIGLIDSGYTGDIKVALWNTSLSDFIVKKGERYTQLVRPDLGLIRMELVKTLRKTDRAEGGFGSTGV